MLAKEMSMVWDGCTVLPEQSTNQTEAGELALVTSAAGLVIRETQGRQLWGAGKF